MDQTTHPPEQRVVDVIVTVRGQRIILASDLASLYGVSTSQLNQAVRRNADRFPADFSFRLTRSERDEVITICDHLTGLRFAPTMPLAFTEYGAVMAATVLNSQRAIEVSVHVVRAFVTMRNAAVAHTHLARRLDALERRYDGQFKIVSRQSGS